MNFKKVGFLIMINKISNFIIKFKINLEKHIDYFLFVNLKILKCIYKNLKKHLKIEK